MNIKELRIKLGLSQEKLAKKLSVSWATVNRWETGKHKPSSLAMQQLESLAKEADGK
tara:strand:- start:8113 stop:8283 length:171 start_codon:yes stop_codon:yes gene_type:complete